MEKDNYDRYITESIIKTYKKQADEKFNQSIMKLKKMLKNYQLLKEWRK